MKNKLYLYGALAIIAVVIGYAVVRSSPSPESKLADACIQAGGTWNASTQICTPKNAEVTTKGNTTTITVKPTPVTPAKPTGPATSYKIHVSTGGLYAYYSTSTVADMIKVYNPPTNTSIIPPITLAGQARGSWFFEGSAPVLLTDSNGKILARGVIKATNNWMTTDWVAFQGELTFPRLASGSKGALVFMNDNPSGLPSNQKAYEMLVTFQ